MSAASGKTGSVPLLSQGRLIAAPGAGAIGSWGCGWSGGHMGRSAAESAGLPLPAAGVLQGPWVNAARGGIGSLQLLPLMVSPGLAAGWGGEGTAVQ